MWVKDLLMAIYKGKCEEEGNFKNFALVLFSFRSSWDDEFWTVVLSQIYG